MISGANLTDHKNTHISIFGETPPAGWTRFRGLSMTFLQKRTMGFQRVSQKPEITHVTLRFLPSLGLRNPGREMCSCYRGRPPKDEKMKLGR